MDDFFSWALLATYAGATIATGLITQWLKGIFAKLPTQILSYFIALIILLLATFFTGQLTWEAGALAVVNAVVVSLAANGGYSGVQRLSGK